MANKITLFIMGVLCLLLTVSGCSVTKGTTVDSIKKNGILTVGVKADVPGFGYLNPVTNQYEGLEIDIAKLLAKEFLGDVSWVKFVPVTSKTRGGMLDSEQVDMVIATFTVTEERKLMYNFSTPYYTDYIGIMVKKDSTVKNLADLNGKTIGVIELAPTQDALQKIADSTGIHISFVQYPLPIAARDALEAGTIDAFSVGTSVLNGYLDKDTKILTERYSPQPSGIATKLSNKALAQSIDKLINKWLNDGTIASLINKNHV